MATQKVTIAVKGIKSANNFSVRELTGEYAGETISTVNIAPDALVSVKADDQDKALAIVKSTLSNFKTKDGVDVEQYQLKLAEDVSIVNKVGVPLDIEGNLDNVEVEANLVAVTGVDKKYHKEYLRVIGIVLNVTSAAEVSIYEGVKIGDEDLFI